MAVIGIMDSGVGGLSVFREIRSLIPSARYIYYSDNANCPYGEKTAAFITQRCHSIAEFFIGRGVDVMVVACNTATAAAIGDLRESYSIPFIGMEPAVKQAALKSRTGVIGVLATKGTLKGTNYLKLKDIYSRDVKITEQPGLGFVEAVESLQLDTPQTELTVRASLQPLLDKGADVIVLGCTHYPFLMPVIRRVAGEGVTVIDPAPAVATHLRDVLEQNGIAEDDGNPSVELVCSGSDVSLRALFAQI